MVPSQSNGTKSAYTRQPRIAYSLRPRVPQVAVHCTRAERLIDVCGVRGLSRSEPCSHSVQLGSGKQAFCMASALRPATRLSLAKSLALAHDNPLPLFFPMHLLLLFFSFLRFFFARRQKPTRPAERNVDFDPCMMHLRRSQHHHTSANLHPTGPAQTFNSSPSRDGMAKSKKR